MYTSSITGQLAALTADQQVNIYYESVAAWYAALVACQFFNVWACKTRVISIFEHGVFDNFVTMGEAVEGRRERQRVGILRQCCRNGRERKWT